MNTIYNLAPQYLNQKSFYGKAKVTDCGLVSYNTKVIKKSQLGDFVWDYEFKGVYSMTTRKHIKEYLMQETRGRVSVGINELREYRGFKFNRDTMMAEFY